MIALDHAQNIEGMYVDETQKGMAFCDYKNLLLVGGGDHRNGKTGENWGDCVTLHSSIIQARKNLTGQLRAA